MAPSPDTLKTQKDCLALLHQVMTCVDKVLLPAAPEHQDKLELAAAYIQQAIALFDDTEACDS